MLLEMEPESKKSTWGGLRPGAGRPRSPLSRRSRQDAACEIVERLAYVRFLGAAASRSLASEIPTDWTLHSREVHETLDLLISLIGSVIDRDGRPFSDDEYRRWAASWRSVAQ